MNDGEDAVDAVLAALLVTPFIGAAAALLPGPGERTLPWAAAVAFTLATLIMLPFVRGASLLLATRFGGIGFHADGAGMVLAAITVLNGLLILLYSRDYLGPGNAEHPVREGFPRYYALFMVFLGAMLCAAFAQDLLTFALFFEMTGLCSCLLIGYYRGKLHVDNGYWALLLTHVGGVGLLVAAAELYTHAGGLAFSSIATLRGTALLVAGLGFVAAAVAKSAQVPLYMWLPRAMVAPTTVSAYLHAASMVNLGVFALYRFASEAGACSVLGFLVLAVSLVTMFYAAFMYFSQKDVKGLLAYSTIVQLAYMLLALGIGLSGGGGYALRASLYHMWNHSFAKALLFLSAGALAYSLGTRSIDALRGLSSLPQPWRTLALFWGIGAAAVIGVPPLSCFYSKLAIVAAGLHAGGAAAVATVLALAETVLTFAAFARTIAWSVEDRAMYEPRSRPTMLMLAVLVVLSVLVLAAPYMFSTLLAR